MVFTNTKARLEMTSHLSLGIQGGNFILIEHMTNKKLRGLISFPELRELP